MSAWAQSAQSDKYGGEVVLATTSDPKSFNDILAKETSTTLVTGLLFEGLTKTNAETLKVEPQLAQSWDISEDGLVWTFYLRKDVLWFDGRSFTADDVVFTYKDLIFNENIPGSARDIFTIDGKEFDVKKVDDYTVVFVLPVRFAPFLRGLSQAILPKHVLEQSVKDGTFNFTWGIDSNPKDVIGTGPYMLVEYQPGQRLVFKRNPHYWRVQDGYRLPFIDKIIYLIVQNTDVSLLKFLEGTLDAYSLRGMDYPLLKPLEAKKDFMIYDLGPDMGSNFITFNQNTGINPKTNKPYVEPWKVRWFSNVQFRDAVAHAIDKQRIIDIVKSGLGYPQYSPMGPGTGFFHNPNVLKRPYDLAKARDILMKAGFVDRNQDGYLEDEEGHVLEFNLYTNSDNTERIDIAAIIRSDLEKLGMKINFRPVQFNVLVAKLTSTFDWDAIVLGLTGGVEPHFGKNVWTSAGQLHVWNPNQAQPATLWEQRVDDIFNAGVQELDEDKRKTYYDEFQQLISEQVPLIYTVLSARVTAVRNKFENIRPTNYGGVFHNLEELSIKPQYR